jgi:NAD(P)-dependent dehydrogenase (short-subunit alcohol dehydrogenase family)
MPAFAGMTDSDFLRVCQSLQGKIRVNPKGGTMELFDLKEKVAIVTGGNRGIGFAITELNKKYFAENPADLQERIDSIPMARVGDPVDLVGAAIFLASDASNFVTGQTLLVDGGSTLW